MNEAANGVSECTSRRVLSLAIASARGKLSNKIHFMEPFRRNGDVSKRPPATQCVVQSIEGNLSMEEFGWRFQFCKCTKLFNTLSRHCATSINLKPSKWRGINYTRAVIFAAKCIDWKMHENIFSAKFRLVPAAASNSNEYRVSSYPGIRCRHINTKRDGFSVTKLQKINKMVRQ